jgi:predicted MFS family arabinose efflux permease
LQVFLAFAYSFLQTGDLVYLTKRNKEKAASVGILNSILGFCLGIGPLFGGFISEYYGFQGVMFFGSFLALCGFLVMTAWPQHPKTHK